MMEVILKILELAASLLGLDWGKIRELLQRPRYKFVEDRHTIELVDDEKQVLYKRKTIVKTNKKKVQQIKIRDYEFFRKYRKVDLQPACIEDTGFSVLHSGSDPRVVSFSEHTLENKSQICRTVEMTYWDCSISIAPPGNPSSPMKAGPELSFIINDTTDGLWIKVDFKKTKCATVQLEKILNPSKVYRQQKKPDSGPDYAEIYLEKPKIGDEYRLSTWLVI